MFLGKFSPMKILCPEVVTRKLSWGPQACYLETLDYFKLRIVALNILYFGNECFLNLSKRSELSQAVSILLLTPFWPQDSILFPQGQALATVSLPLVESFHDVLLTNLHWAEDSNSFMCYLPLLLPGKCLPYSYSQVP